jgi:hypothetical protein
MEPFSALAIVTGVVQFIDFSAKLIAGTYTIYRSKSRESTPDSHVMVVTTMLQTMNEELRRDFVQQAKGQSSQTELDIAKLCADCSAIAEELIAVLHKLPKPGKHDVWTSFLLTFRSIWSQDKINSLKQKLDEFRQQITMHLLVLLRYV